MSQLGSLAALTGLGSSAGVKDPNDLYLAVLQSNTVADGLIKRLDLMKAYHTKQLSEARRLLAANSKFVSEKGGMISITVKDGDPHRPPRLPMLTSTSCTTLTAVSSSAKPAFAETSFRSSWRSRKTG